MTYPHVVLRSRQQDYMNLSYQNKYYGLDSSHKPYLTLREVIKHTLKNQGIKGFYGGLGVDLVKVLPTNTILMLCFEYFRYLLKSNSKH